MCETPRGPNHNHIVSSCRVPASVSGHPGRAGTVISQLVGDVIWKVISGAFLSIGLCDLCASVGVLSVAASPPSKQMQPETTVAFFEVSIARCSRRETPSDVHAEYVFGRFADRRGPLQASTDRPTRSLGLCISCIMPLSAKDTTPLRVPLVLPLSSSSRGRQYALAYSDSVRLLYVLTSCLRALPTTLCHVFPSRGRSGL
jgi:hypothetical protein